MGSGSELSPIKSGQITTISSTLLQEMSYDKDEEPALDEEQCKKITSYAFDLDVDRTVLGVHPAEAVMRELLRLQGVDDATAMVVARVLLRIDMASLMLSSSQAANILGISKISLLRHRQSGRFEPALTIASETGRQGTVTYWLSSVLYTLAWRFRHPRTGGPEPWFPEIPAPAKSGG